MLKNKRIFSVILSVSLLCGVSNVAPVFAQDTNIGTTRLSGNDRYKTSLAISKSGWTQANTVILATGADYPDALSAAPLAKSNDAPILLTEKNALSSDTIAEIQRLKAANAILVGGTGVISTNVESQLKNMGVNFTRIGGINRYETSKLVAEKLGTSNGIIVATGLDFPDALSIAPIAGIKSMPILLSPKDGLDPSVATFIKGKSIPVSYIVGGTGVLGDTVSSSVPNSKRLGGKNRYETNQIINNQFVGNLSTGTVFLATGNDFPDALSGSALSAKNNAPIILSDINSITSDALNFVKSQSVRNVTILGGTGAISGNVQDILTNVISGNIVIPSSVSLNKTTDTLTVGHTDTLIATVSPSNATNKNVQWSTSNGNVATVDAAGKVTAIGAGTATITATTVDGNKTASYNITVENPVINVSSVSLNKTTDTLTVGNTDTLIAAVSPSNAANKSLQWSTSDSNVAAVDAAGKVTAIGAGTATITATTVDGNKTASCIITVENPVINVTSVSLNKTTDTLIIGNTDTLVATVLPSNATNNNVLWNTSNGNVATVDAAGKVTAIGVGTATITATSIDGNKTASCTVTVNDIIVTFKDKNLEQAVRNAINKLTGTLYKSDVIHITYLRIHNMNISDISGIENLSNLQILALENNQVSNISALKGLTNLQYISLYNNQVSDVSALNGLTNLQSLTLDNNQISDINAFSGLSNLQYLYLNNNQISNISALNGLTKLKDLYLTSNQISDVSALKGLINLEWLYLDGNQISDISALNGLTKLQYLFLEVNQISDISALSGLTSLQVLYLEDNQISNVNALNGLATLQGLFLDNNQISDINALKDLTNLQYLGLDNNQISDISALRGLTNLQNINLEYNKISDISALSSLTNLQGLDLTNNEIIDISALNGLTNLQYLYLDNNQIIDISALKGLVSLQYLSLSGNQISITEQQEIKTALPNCVILF